MKVPAFLTDSAVADKIINHLKISFVANKLPPPPHVAYCELHLIKIRIYIWRQVIKQIPKIDKLVLVALWKLGKDAYGVAIQEEIIRATGVNWLPGAIYGPLALLHRRGLAASVKGAPTPDRGGRAKVYCELTPAGKTALMKIQEVNAVMWKGSRKIEV